MRAHDIYCNKNAFARYLDLNESGMKSILVTTLVCD